VCVCVCVCVCVYVFPCIGLSFASPDIYWPVQSDSIFSAVYLDMYAYLQDDVCVCVCVCVCTCFHR